MNTHPNSVVHRFLATGRLHRRCIEKTVKGLHIHRSQHRMLMHLFRCENQPTQKELAEHLQISPAAVAIALKKLESDGYILRQTDPGDTRQNRIAITEKGKDILDCTKRLFDDVDAKMLQGLTREQLDVLETCLGVMQANLLDLVSDNEETNP